VVKATAATASKNMFAIVNSHDVYNLFVNKWLSFYIIRHFTFPTSSSNFETFALVVGNLAGHVCRVLAVHT
jgi:hypothetical protein